MAVNQVNLANGEELINLTEDTVSEDTLLENVTAHDASGKQITGKVVVTPVDSELNAESENAIQNKAVAEALQNVDAKTVNSHTVEADVPEDAKFTDTTYSAATTSANGLMAATDKSKLDNTNMAYGTCATAAATAAKVVTITGNTNWKLAVGSEIVVKFTNTNTASNCTLNVNNTGAKQIWYNNAVYTAASNAVCGYANRYFRYMYDGTYWVWMGWSLDANTWTAASATANGYVSTGTQTFAGAKTFNGAIYPNGATAYGTPQARKLSSGTAAPTTSNCPSGAWYGKHS